MNAHRVLCVALVIVGLGGWTLAQEDELPLKNWGAPPYWTRPAEGEAAGGMTAHAQGMQARAEALPSSPLPFVAITPCRIVDTRVAVADGFHEPNFTDAETRTFTLPSSPDCTGLPATAGAWSLNVQFRPIASASYITLFPTGTTMPPVSTLTASPAAWVEDAAIVPAGTGGAIDVYCQFAGRVVIDINGYYGPQSVVTSLTSGVTTLTGDVTLAQGSNVTITPSGSTFTIAATGGPGGVLPAGGANQTLRNDGASWVASSALTNDGTNVAITGNLDLPATTSTTGQLTMAGTRLLHAYAGPGTDGENTFVGQQAGNLTMGGTPAYYGSFNTAIGFQSLYSNTTGFYNTAEGVGSLASNTTGTSNTAIGIVALTANTTGINNTATGSQSLASNTTGSLNTAVGANALAGNTTGAGNTATGQSSMAFNTLGSDNTATGLLSLFANTTASRNTAVGNQAMYTQSFANGGVPWNTSNTAVGDSALFSNQPTSTSTGIYNTAVGDSSLFSNTVGDGNTAEGVQSLYSNTTGADNTATGFESLYSNTTATGNTASGFASLYSNTTGVDNTAMGTQSLHSNTTANHNTAVGFDSLFANTTGADNTATGTASLTQNTTGDGNTALGEESILSNTTGADNTATGFQSLYSNTTATGNTASGFASLYSNTTGAANTATGTQSLHANTTANYNTATGFDSLFSHTSGDDNTATGFESLYASTTGIRNTAVGAIAGNRTETINAYGGGTASIVPTVTGSYDTFVGYGTGATTEVDNCTAVGTDAYCTATNQVRLGNVFVSSIGGEVAWSALSDIRAKTDVRDVSLGLDFVMALRPVEYKLKSGNGKTDMGFVAQDIEALLGDGYNVLDVGGDPERTLSLRHTDLIAPLVKAIQEQQATIAALKAELDELHHEVKALKEEHPATRN